MAKPKIIQLIEDIAYATMGVENSEHNKKQFEQSSWPIYFIAGILGIALFVAVIAGLVYFLL
jgi:hypothetical protein